MHDAYTEGNMGNIPQTIPINIYNKLGVIESIFIIVDYTSEKNEIYATLFKEDSDVFRLEF